jgi:hypothetical protein
VILHFLGYLEAVQSSKRRLTFLLFLKDQGSIWMALSTFSPIVRFTLSWENGMKNRFQSKVFFCKELGAAGLRSEAWLYLGVEKKIFPNFSVANVFLWLN